jgi:SpoVK/Ycf46/Vps4 family AAA+-type ATPase
MASPDQLKALIQSHINRDDGSFYSVAMQLAAHEARLGHGKLAAELRDIIDAAKARVSRNDTGKLVAIGSAAKPKGALGDLLMASYPANRIAEMVLDSVVLSQLQRIVKEQRMLARIKEHGLSPRRKLLLVGPPGTGKTMTAAVLAGELGIPLFTVRLDSLITKFMGETAAKLRQVFDAIAELRGVYFFDEFDAIGTQRSATNDVGEMRRVLNSFLQMIEHDQSNSLVIAATNHPEALDFALFRRFDDVLQYHLPTKDQALHLIKTRLAHFAPKVLKTDALAKHGVGLSYAEISKAVEDSIKQMIMHEAKSVLIKDLLQALDERHAFGNMLKRPQAASMHG